MNWEHKTKGEHLTQSREVYCRSHHQVNNVQQFYPRLMDGQESVIYLKGALNYKPRFTCGCEDILGVPHDQNLWSRIFLCCRLPRSRPCAAVVFTRETIGALSFSPAVHHRIL